MTIDGPFRGSEAVAAGLLTPAMLRSGAVLQVFRDVYVTAGTELDLRMRSRAAHLLVPDDGALCGHSAAEMLGAACSPRNAAAEIVAPRGDIRPRRGLIVRQAALDPTETVDVSGCRVTSPLRTAYDLGRRLALVDAVAAIDSLARVGRFAPNALVHGPVGARGCRRLREAVALANPLSESAQESRLRVVLAVGGLPAPTVQYRVRDRSGRVIARVDLAYEEAKIALEYDGEHHFDDEFSRKDRLRDLRIGDFGWLTLRFTAEDIESRRGETVDRVRRRLAERTVDNDAAVIKRAL
jgi:very-short-patch-repair endonuclease